MKTRRNLVQFCLLCAAILQSLSGGAQPVTQIAGGGYQSIFLKSDGSLWAMGYNAFGQLGDGTYNSTNYPEQIVVASNATAIAAGFNHSLFLKCDGSLWAMGDNTYGELGDGTNDSGNYNTNRPEQIVASNVTAIATGQSYSLFLKSNGSLWAMGYNAYGQLGDGTFGGFSFYTNRPEQIVASNVTAIAAGRYHTLFLKSDGSLWAMGYNNFGQLGDGTYNKTNLPEQIVASNVTAIAAAQNHSLFLKSDGSLWAMGYNAYGQLGDGTTINKTNLPEQIVSNNVTAITGGEFHSLFLKSDGSLWAMGYNLDGELGDGTYNGTNRPEQIVTGGVMAIAAGLYHSLYLKNDGSLWAAGNNYDGQLGDGTTDNGYLKTNKPEQILGPYNQIQTAGRLLGGTNMQLNFVGVANSKYVLDRSSSLSPANWIPQATNAASSFGPLVFTNAPIAGMNNFWRIRSVQ
jgi:alpha-tubulin suppressor-like RCC1 family protein